LRPPPR